MNAPAIPVFDLAHRTERVTNISPASDAFVLFTLATLFFTIGCFVVWMWFIWRRGIKSEARRGASQMQLREFVPPASRQSSAEPEEPAAPWEKPADWWKK